MAQLDDFEALGRQWSAARSLRSRLHLDHAACSRQSLAVIDAATEHAHREAELGGYAAAEDAAPALAAGCAAIGTLTGLSAEDVVFTTGANQALDLLLSAWTGERTLACLPGEYGPNLAIMTANGFGVETLPTDGDGRLMIDQAASRLATCPPALVHLTALSSHRGIAQPIAEFATVCESLRVPLVIDAAQALGHLDCAHGAAAIYGSSRKWIAGPRGVGFLALRSDFAARLTPRIPSWPWGSELSVVEQLARGEANVAARVAFSRALSEHLDSGPALMRRALARVGRSTRETLRAANHWRVVEVDDEPTAITTLELPDGVDVADVRRRLMVRHGIVTTAIPAARAPFELSTSVLRLSPHVDANRGELSILPEALEDSICCQ